MGLPNLDIWQQIVDDKGYPTLPFHVWWQEFVKNQNSTNESLQDQLSTLTGLDGSISDVLSAAESAVVVNSGTLNATLTGRDAGSTASIDVSGHVRVYGDGATVSVNPGSINGLAFGTTYYVYYDQESREGGAVPYQATSVKLTAVQTGARHFVGVVTTPANGSADTSGTTIDPPGFYHLPGAGGGGGISGSGTFSLDDNTGSFNFDDG